MLRRQLTIDASVDEPASAAAGAPLPAAHPGLAALSLQKSASQDDHSVSPGSTLRSLDHHDALSPASQLRAHSTSHRSSSGKSPFSRAQSTPSDLQAHTTPWGHSLTTLEGWAVVGAARDACARADSGQGLNDTVSLETYLARTVSVPAPDARATCLVVFHPLLPFDMVLSALRCHAELDPFADQIYYYLEALTPKQRIEPNAALAIGKVLAVTASWQDPRLFEAAEVVDAMCAFDLQASVDGLRVALCMPKVEFEKLMLTWQTKHGSGIKTSIVPHLLANAKRLDAGRSGAAADNRPGPSDRAAHVVCTLGLWCANRGAGGWAGALTDGGRRYLNLPLVELLKLGVPKTHNQVSKQARIMQTLTAALVDKVRRRRRATH
jgi:hypothetical protein